MNFLILGRGKTGSLVAEVARQRKHHVEVLASAENVRAQALSAERLATVNVAIDFTTPDAVLQNVNACIDAGKNIVVGTTGWYDDLPKVELLVRERGTGFLYGSNFSVGVNLFFEIAKAAAAAI